MHSILASTLIILAQVDPNAAIESFKLLLGKLLLLVGVGVMAYGGYLVSRQGHLMDGILCIIGGFLIAIAIPLMSYLASLSGITF